jgi:hypothetical protein
VPVDVTGAWPWVSLAALGAFHGLNPAMGWLFAVALGLQEGRRRAVCRALIPIALGHAVSIATVAAAASIAQALVEPRLLRFTAAAILIGFGVYYLLARVRHRALAGMRVSGKDLAIWSFVTATGHGAGLMLVPPLLALASAPSLHAGHHGHAMPGLTDAVSQGIVAVVVHTGAMLVVAGAVAVIVFDWVGVAFLRRAWVNFDIVWAVALVLAGGLLLIV